MRRLGSNSLAEIRARHLRLYRPGRDPVSRTGTDDSDTSVGNATPERKCDRSPTTMASNENPVG